jgi:shikimate kinase
LEATVAIVGYMGSGKTTVGRALAHELGSEFVDLDRTIEKEAARGIAELFEHCGEEYFRDLEQRALAVALEGGPARVVACGGGIVVRPENRERLRGVATVFLQEDLGVLYKRTRGAGRPLRAASREGFERRYAERLAFYEEVADLDVAVGGRAPKAVAEEIARWLLGA